MGPQLKERASARLSESSGSWHFLYFLPLPHQQGSFLPGRTTGLQGSLLLNNVPSFSHMLILLILPSKQCVDAAAPDASGFSQRGIIPLAQSDG